MRPSVTQNETAVTPPQHKALQLLEANPRLFAQQGSVVATWRICSWPRGKPGPASLPCGRRWVQGVRAARETFV